MKFRIPHLIPAAIFLLALTAPHAAFSADSNNQDPLPLDQITTFAKVFETIKNNYIEDISDEELLQAAVRGMISGLDPHSSLLNNRELSEVRSNTSGRYGGLGIEITKDNLGIRVVSPIDDTPAHEAGILPGDLIVRLDNRSVSRMTLTDAVNMMRGEPGTKITLTIIRQGADSPLNITLTRAVIRIKSVRSYFLDQNFGYLRITQFQTPTPALARSQILKLRKDSESLDGLVLDLRNNPGGELESAIGVSDLFIEEGVIVKTRGRNGADEDVFRATPGDLADGIPVVVLVNEGSASASEIVAGALQDHRRAIIMGTKSFGKGSVQTILSVDRETTIKLTTHRYYTPSGRSIQAQGIVPDIAVERREIPTPDADEQEIETLREADLEGSLENQDENDLTDEQLPESGSQVNPAVAQDYQLQEALNLLKGLRISRQMTG